MIDSIEVINYQGHKHSLLECSKGLNIIKGESHSGKTSLMRALELVLNNYPQGYDYKPYFVTDDKTLTQVSVEFTEGAYVARLRNKKTNSYIVSDIDGSLEAMRGDVPEEVQQITQMDEMNIQSQHSPFFLLQDSPGKRAKVLNKSTGLEEIDQCLASINTIINTAKNKMEYKKEDLDKTKDRFAQYEGIEEVGKLIDKLEVEQNKKNDLDGKIGLLNKLREEIIAQRNRVEKYKGFLTIETYLPRLRALYQGKMLFEKQYHTLNNLKTSIENTRARINKATKLLQIEPIYLSLKDHYSSIYKTASRIDSLKKLSTSIKKQRLLKVVAGTQLVQKEKQYFDLLKTLKICPLCKQPIGG